MASTTDFEEWLSDNEPDSLEEAHNLFEAADGVSAGYYDSQLKGEKVYIKSGSGDTLALVSEKARKAFQKRLADYNPHKDLGWEGALAFERAMRKDD